MVLKFRVNGVRSWKRPSHDFVEFNGKKKVWVYNDKTVREWEWKVMMSAMTQGLVYYPPITETDIGVKITAYVKNTWFRDVDNIAKGILDALQPWLIEDDKYITHLLVKKKRTQEKDEYVEVELIVDGYDEGMLGEKQIAIVDKRWNDSLWVKDLGMRAVYKMGKFVISDGEKAWMGTPARTRKKFEGLHIVNTWRKGMF